eukprot:EG_transcript_30682
MSHDLRGLWKCAGWKNGNRALEDQPQSALALDPTGARNRQYSPNPARLAFFQPGGVQPDSTYFPLNRSQPAWTPPQGWGVWPRPEKPDWIGEEIGAEHKSAQKRAEMAPFAGFWGFTSPLALENPAPVESSVEFKLVSRWILHFF